METKQSACSAAPDLKDRNLINSIQAGELMSLFKVLANDTRLQLLHALSRSGDLCVMELARELEIKPQAVSNQLQRLADRRIVRASRCGNTIRYRIVDPRVLRLLELGLCLIEETKQ